mmetsp:Transcript_18799/g.48952  ORF Transcript_18799/g.48952 Transcript_18799/m.48952 type:complete len:251 (+) Transcript_18799:710-1462(+)
MAGAGLVGPCRMHPTVSLHCPRGPWMCHSLATSAKYVLSRTPWERPSAPCRACTFSTKIALILGFCRSATLHAPSAKPALNKADRGHYISAPNYPCEAAPFETYSAVRLDLANTHARGSLLNTTISLCCDKLPSSHDCGAIGSPNGGVEQRKYIVDAVSGHVVLQRPAISCLGNSASLFGVLPVVVQQLVESGLVVSIIVNQVNLVLEGVWQHWKHIHLIHKDKSARQQRFVQAMVTLPRRWVACDDDFR